jgi:hypothetical protein
MRAARSKCVRTILVAVACCALLNACAPTAVTEEGSPPPAASAQPAPKTPPLTDAVIGALCDERTGLSLRDAEADSWDSLAQRRAAAAIQCDAYEIMLRVSSLGTSAAEVSRLHDQVRTLAQLSVDDVRASPIESSRLPLSPPHQRMYEVAAQAERAAGSAELQVWTANPWASLDPLARAPDGAPHALSTALMRGERRAMTLNVRDSSSASRTLQIEIRAPGIAADAVQVFRVNWTGNDLSSWAAAELEPLGDALAARQTLLLPGVTQQIWIQIRPDFAAAPGRFEGSISLTPDGGLTTRIPLILTVFKGRLASQASLHFGGWDYADGRIDPRYNAADVSQSELAKHLQERLVDTPWARRHVMPWARLDADGNLAAPADTAAMEQWLAPWTDARRFRIFLNVGQDIAGIPTSDPRFPRAVAAWAQSWAAELRRLGKSPEQFDLLLVDEPDTREQAHATELWANAVRQSGAGFRIWTDPIWRDPFATPRSLIDAADTVSINIGIADRAGTAYWNWVRQLARAGKNIELYGTEGPARRLDPYAYYRLTMWKAFFVGATGVSFWSFADTGGSAADAEFGAARFNYSPLFIAPQIRSGKHLQAAMEGIQDTQYLEMLQRTADGHPSAAVRQRASQLLNDASSFVARAPPSTHAQWAHQTESSEADRLRLAIGEFLDSLIS